MALILLLLEDEYDHTKQRFRSEAFEPYDDGSGISVFDRECACEKSGCECAHADHYYRPPIPAGAANFYFWEFDPGQLPTGSTLASNPSTSGDDCHKEIGGLTKKAAKAFFRKKPYAQRDQFVSVYKSSAGVKTHMHGHADSESANLMAAENTSQMASI